MRTETEIKNKINELNNVIAEINNVAQGLINDTKLLYDKRESQMENIISYQAILCGKAELLEWVLGS